MKSASTTLITAALPNEPPNEVTGGLDWARDDHAASVVDARSRELVRHNVEHSAAGLAELVGVFGQTGCREVAIERPDGPVVDALLAAGITVVVISPNQVKNLRGRYGPHRQQRRPLQCVRAGRHAAYRPGPAAASHPGRPGDRRAAPQLPHP